MANLLKARLRSHIAYSWQLDFPGSQKWRPDYIAERGTTKVLDIPHCDVIDDSTCVAVVLMEATNEKGQKANLK